MIHALTVISGVWISKIVIARGRVMTIAYGRSTKIARHTANVLFWLAAIVLTINLVRGAIPRAKAQSSAAAVVPYTVIYELHLIMPDGREHPQSPTIMTYALASDGSRAFRMESTKLHERIIELASGKKQTIFDTLGKKSTEFNPEPIKPQDYVRSAANHCVGSANESFAGEDQISGYRVARITHPGGSSFYALDHGCAPLGLKQDWGEKGRNETRLVSLVAGEPSPELFADPPSYQEVPPSVLFPHQPTTERDAYYLAHRPVR
jgi:hypothetical protein